MADQEMGEFIAGITQQISGHLEALSGTLGAQGVAQVVDTFKGDPTKYKTWIKSIEKYGTLTNAPRDRLKLIAYQSSSGAVSDFLSRYMADHDRATWDELKRELAGRFAEITDAQHAFMILQTVKQTHGESVQMYAERLLNLAEEAYAELVGDGNGRAIERQLVGFFTNGLAHDYLKLKMLRKPRYTSSCCA